MNELTFLQHSAYYEILRGVQQLTWVQMVSYCIENDIDPAKLPILSAIYTRPMEPQKRSTPVGFIDINTPSPKVLFISFDSEEPVLESVLFSKYLAEYVPFSQKSSVATVVTAETSIKS